MLLLNCALKLVEEIIVYYYARSKKTSKWAQGVTKHFALSILGVPIIRVCVTSELLLYCEGRYLSDANFIGNADLVRTSLTIFTVLCLSRFICVFLCIAMQFVQWLLKEILEVGAFRLFGAASILFISKDRDCTVRAITRYWLGVLSSECCGILRRAYGCLQNWQALWFSRWRI